MISDGPKTFEVECNFCGVRYESDALVYEATADEAIAFIRRHRHAASQPLCACRGNVHLGPDERGDYHLTCMHCGASLPA